MTWCMVSYIRLLDTVHHQGIRLSLWPFRTSPIQSLYVKANELSLENRHLRLALQYKTKLSANKNTSAYHAVFNKVKVYSSVRTTAQAPC